MKNKSRNIFFAFGVIAIVIMIFTFEVSFEELWQRIKDAGYYLIPIIGMWFFLYMMNAWSWRIIIKGSGDCPISYWKLFKITITGFALNYATPAGLMGGEPYKIMELKPYIGVQRASSSVLLFAMMHIFSHFWYWMTSVVLYIAFMWPIDVYMGVVMGLVALFSGAGIYLFTKGYKNGMVVNLVNFVSKIPGLKKWGKKFAETHAEDLHNIDSQIAALQGQNKRSFYASFFLEYIGRILQSFEIYFMLILFCPGEGNFMTFIKALLILAFTSLFANLLFFLPLQLGGREGGFALSTAQLGMTGQVSMSVSIICRVRELFWTAVGLLLMKVGNKSIPNDEQSES